MSESKKIVFDVSFSAFFKLGIIVLGAVLLYLVRDVLLLMFLAFIIASASLPFIDFMQKHKIPRTVSAIFLYLVLLGMFAGIIALVIPPLAFEVRQLGGNLPDLIGSIEKNVEGASGITLEQGVSEFSKYLSSISEKLDEAIVSAYSVVSSFFGSIFSVVVVFVLSFYFMIQENAFKKFLESFVPKKHRKHAVDLSEKIQIQMGRWVRGQLILGLIVGIATYITLSIMGVKYALILAIIAGALEVIPYLGPVIAAIPAAILAFIQNPLLGLFVLIAYIVIQQIENHVLVPKIMQRAVGLNPLVIIIAILAGAQIAGAAGAIIAVPVATASGVLLSDYFNEQRAREEESKTNANLDDSKK